MYPAIGFDIILFLETLPKAKTNDKTKPIGKEIIKRSKVLSKPDKTSTKLRNNNDWLK